MPGRHQLTSSAAIARPGLSHSALLSVGEMQAADAAAIARGIAGRNLMERAGIAVAREALRRWPGRRMLVVCGPGNNGGDGFVAARHLQEAGIKVRVALLGERGRLKGEAALAVRDWPGGIEAMSPDLLASDDLVIDALFGAGLDRDITGVAREVIQAIAARALDSLAVDVPSGVDGNTGAARGGAAPARATVTFCRAKPGHYLLPGRHLCGETVVADIGIPDDVVDGLNPRCWLNGPAVWGEAFPWPKPEEHKYSRGHLVILGGGRMTGAGRLAARAARRGGAGMITLLAPAESLSIYAADQPGLLTAPDSELERYLADKRVSALLIGPGNGATDETRRHVLAALAAAKPCLLDADAITVFAGTPAALFDAIRGPVLLTPHEGEFARLFPTLAGDKLSRARAAAKASGATVLLKGSDTVIAAADGRALINANAPPTLATAGAGDTLAGIAAAMMAQGTEPFLAAGTAAWLHGAAATRFGPGLIAEDLADELPAVLRALMAGGQG
jgi:ADP-dependent NAD(P)H-hydrate dehydratase / NAD(P)H-hydrate epimerase